ncbi:MAG: hypothetical protein NTY14_08380 [Candidatus Omnitrophica bacterium]|nr:hypothetical protein [Candidatus Omnitrophota bacterium]
MKIILSLAGLMLLPVSILWAGSQWEKQNDFYYLSKDTRDNFSAIATGANKFTDKYLKCDGVDFLVRGADSWRDYGRLNLEGNNLFSVPIRPGMKVEELHFLSGGNVGNSYKNDGLLRLYGDNYFYGVLTVIFAYQDNTYKSLSVPMFWDWFHLGAGEWSREGAKIKSLGNNPVRKDSSMFHISFVNPRPSEPIKNILVTDSWVRDYPFTEIFAVTLKSVDMLEATAKDNRKFEAPVNNAVALPADSRTQWFFDNDLEGWVPGCSANWDSDSFWQATDFERSGVVIIPACNWAGDKFSWIEKKVVLPDWPHIELKFSRHSAVFSDVDKQWSDGLLKVIVKNGVKQETVYEKLYSGVWSAETVDLSKFARQIVIIRFENHGGGKVRLGPATSSACDAEDAVIDEVSLSR